MEAPIIIVAFIIVICLIFLIWMLAASIVSKIYQMMSELEELFDDMDNKHFK